MTRLWGILATGYPHVADPVAGSFVREMARALAARGERVRVLCIGHTDDAPVRDEGVEVVSVREPFGQAFYGSGAPEALGFGGGATSVRAWAGAGAAVGALAVRARTALASCDVLVSHFVLPCGLIGAMVRAGRRHLMVVHGTDGWLLAHAPPAIQRGLLASADLVWYSHAGLRDALHHPPGTPSWARPMGGAVCDLAPVTHEGEALRVVVVSRLVRLKGVERGVLAVAQLRARGVSVSLCVLGDGPERGFLEALARRVCPGAVRWMGRVDGSTRDEILARSNVMLHTAGAFGTRTEGAPAAIVEAMEAGLPIVACDAGGVRSVVGEGGIVTSASASTADIADALARMCSAEVRQAYGAAGRARALPWRWDETVRAMGDAMR